MGAVYTQLSIEERRRTEHWRHATVPVCEMARVLKRSKATIHREIKRNYFSDEYMPKCDGYARKRDITAVSDYELKMICDRLNNTPRKCLGWKTPAEVFREKMMAEVARPPYPRRQ